jgi:hypothetical protein
VSLKVFSERIDRWDSNLGEKIHPYRLGAQMEYRWKKEEVSQ